MWHIWLWILLNAERNICVHNCSDPTHLVLIFCVTIFVYIHHNHMYPTPKENMKSNKGPRYIRVTDPIAPLLLFSFSHIYCYFLLSFWKTFFLGCSCNTDSWLYFCNLPEISLRLFNDLESAAKPFDNISLYFGEMKISLFPSKFAAQPEKEDEKDMSLLYQLPLSLKRRTPCMWNLLRRGVKGGGVVLVCIASDSS